MRQKKFQKEIMELKTNALLAMGLSPREEMILHLRYGKIWGTEKELNRVILGQCFAVTAERIVQIERKSVRQILHYIDLARSGKLRFVVREP
jgi:DNA-directed RNA polymerase sigma subunit (sigma70/sigma32)